MKPITPFEKTARELLAAGYSIRFRAAGDSMHPTIRNGEIVEVTPLGGRTPRVGEVVLVKAMRGLTAHRIVRVGDGSLVLRGDNSVSNDPELGFPALIGTVSGVERAGVLHPVGGRRLRRLRASAFARRCRRHVAAAVAASRTRLQYR